MHQGTLKAQRIGLNQQSESWLFNYIYNVREAAT